jgi:glycosyltransferase involved in cell wall biosynthesis
MRREKPTREIERKDTLWILTEVYFPEEISTGYYLTSIAEGLAKTRRVKVLTGQPKHMSRGTRAPACEYRNEVEIHRAWGTTLDKNILIFRLINMATIGFSMFWRSLRLFRAGGQVLVVTAPPSLPVTTTIACMVRGASLTLLVQDSYPEILVAVGTARQGSFFVSMIDLVNRWVYKYASKIIVMGRDMKELFERKTSGLDIPVVVIPNWSDIDTISPEPRATNQLLRELGIAEKFVLLYAGNIGHPTDVETVMGAARLLDDRPEFHFVFIGDGAKKKWVKDQAALLRNTTVLDYRPRAEQNIFLNACDIGLVALIKGMWGTAMPSRTYNIMAAGKPVLALTDDESELARVIDEERIGWHIEPGNSGNLRNTILKIYDSRSHLAEMGNRARKAAHARYSPDVAINAYSDAMRS